MVGTFSQITICFTFLWVPSGPTTIRYTCYTFNFFVVCLFVIFLAHVFSF